MATIIQRAMLQVETVGGKATWQSEPRPCCTIDLSKSQANDAALRILRAYKLTGNFHVNLEIILKHLGAVGDVVYEIAPMSTLPYHPDCRHVTFRASENIGIDRFNEIIRRLDAWIGFDAKHWWFGSPQRRSQSHNVSDQAERAIASQPWHQAWKSAFGAPVAAWSEEILVRLCRFLLATSRFGRQGKRDGSAGNRQREAPCVPGHGWAAVVFHQSRRPT
jgi:hypothetical protein